MCRTTHKSLYVWVRIKNREMLLQCNNSVIYGHLWPYLAWLIHQNCFKISFSYNQEEVFFVTLVTFSKNCKKYFLYMNLLVNPQHRLASQNVKHMCYYCCGLDLFIKAKKDWKDFQPISAIYMINKNEQKRYKMKLN